MIEKKTVINLLEAFSVAVKHYFHGEDGIFYDEATSPPGSPSAKSIPDTMTRLKVSNSNGMFLHQHTTGGASQTLAELLVPATMPSPTKSNCFSIQLPHLKWDDKEKEKAPFSPVDEKKSDRPE
ncbi:hypothetical protein VKT23_017704 [Stygiomarasmius scandens]|uniref:Uncharacterized protein n=1 Tax=Marasmiellus scandens TaxID=2682957 RepID=A0ABR1IVG1_9AGAR